MRSLASQLMGRARDEASVKDGRAAVDTTEAIVGLLALADQLAARE